MRNSFVLAMSCVAFLAIFLISQYVLYNFPNSADEYAYVFQAKNLALLQTYHDIHPVNQQGEPIQDYFYLVHIGDTDGKYYGRFPFGYSLLMVPAAWVELFSGINVYWLTNTLFGVFTLVLLFLFADRFFNRRTAIIASFMGLCSAWFLLTSSSYFSHTTNAFFVGAFLYAFCLAMGSVARKDARKWLLIAGFCFGFAVVIRFLDPLPYLLPMLILYWGWQQGVRKRFFHDVAYFSLGGVFWAICLFAYNWNLTGDPLQTAYQYYNPHDQGTRFVFMVTDKAGNAQVDFSRILDVGYRAMTLPNVKRLFDWHVWSWLVLLIPIVFYLRGSQRNSKLLFGTLVFAPLLVIMIYMLYGGPPMNQYGPRYYYSFFVPLTLVCAICAERVLRINWVIVPVMVAFSLVGGHQIYRHLTDFEQQLYERTNLFRTIAQAELSQAVVFLKTGSGNMHQVDLPRNALNFDNEVLIAQDQGGEYGRLIRAHPNRKFYEYHYRGEGQLGELTPIWTSPSGEFRVEWPALAPENELRGVRGLVGQYFAGENFNQLIFHRLDQRFDFDWGQGAPGENFAKDQFSIKWVGYFNAPRAGTYTFTASNDDGIRLAVKDKTLIENWYGHGALTESGHIQLSQGRHRIKIEYFDAYFDASLKVMLSGPGIPQQVLSGKYLTPVLPTPSKP